MTGAIPISGFSLFPTAIGCCGVAWGDRGLVGVQLPEGGTEATRARLAQRFPALAEGKPPSAIARAIAAIDGLMRGSGDDLAAIALDMAGLPDFHVRVYRAARAIRPGSTQSYGQLAETIGAPGAARAVGQALGRNPFPIVVPCHRVLAAGGKAGGFTAHGGLATKRRLLALEGVALGAGPDLLGDGASLPGFDVQAATAHLSAADADLACLIDAVGPCRLELRSTTSLFAMLAEAIVHQQLSTRVAAAIFGRLCALFPRQAGGPGAEQILHVPDVTLRGVGLSQAKLLALRDLAERAVAGAVPTLAELQHLDDATILERLTQVRGIGRWTVEMLLIFRLGRADVLPADDLGIRKGFSVAFGTADLPGRRAVEARGERWRPYRTVASWYLWRAAERAA